MILLTVCAVHEASGLVVDGNHTNNCVRLHCIIQHNKTIAK